MKKHFYTAMAALMVAGMASAETTVAETAVIELPYGYEYSTDVDPVYLDTEELEEYFDVPSLSTNYVTIYAVQNGELSDNYTAAGDGGFWFDKEGIICDWGDGAAVFVEFYNETGYFGVGQFPGALEVGETVDVTIVMVADDMRMDFPMHFVCVEAAGVEGDVVYTEDVAGADALAEEGYPTIEIPFDAEAAAAAIGVEDLETTKYILLNPDGTYATIPSAGNGYYITADGYTGLWGDGDPWFIQYAGGSVLVVGQYGGNSTNATYEADFGFYAADNAKIALIHVTFTVGESGISSTIATKANVSLNGNMLSVSGLNAGAAVKLYTVDGRMIYSGNADNAGSLNANVGNYKGMVLVNAEGKSYKFSK